MTTRIERKGNALTVEIPEEMAAQAELTPGEAVEWVQDSSGGLTLVRASKTPKPKNPADMTLEELLEGLSEGDRLGEYDWGPPRGVEVW